MSGRPSASSVFQIRLLGGLEVVDPQGRRSTFANHKAEGLLALLAMQPGRAVARQRLQGLLWPDVTDERASQSLRQALHALRRVLPGALKSTSRNVTLDAARVRVDVCELTRRIELGTREALSDLASVLRGELLDGMNIAEAPFEAWLRVERERLRAKIAEGLARLHELAPEGETKKLRAELKSKDARPRSKKPASAPREATASEDAEITRTMRGGTANAPSETPRADKPLNETGRADVHTASETLLAGEAEVTGTMSGAATNALREAMLAQSAEALATQRGAASRASPDAPLDEPEATGTMPGAATRAASDARLDEPEATGTMPGAAARVVSDARLDEPEATGTMPGAAARVSFDAMLGDAGEVTGLMPSAAASASFAGELEVTGTMRVSGSFAGETEVTGTMPASAALFASAHADDAAQPTAAGHPSPPPENDNALPDAKLSFAATLLLLGADEGAEMLRRAELDSLLQAHEEARQGRGALQLVSGDIGVGKSHVLRTFAQLAAAEGRRVVRVRCFEAERAMPFACWLPLLNDARAEDPAWFEGLPADSRAELLRILPDLISPAAHSEFGGENELAHTPDLAGPRAVAHVQRELVVTDELARAPELDGPPGLAHLQRELAGEDELALFVALDLVVTRLAASQPLLVICEDLHSADDMSLRLLAFVARRNCRATNFFMIASVRSAELHTGSLLNIVVDELTGEGLLARNDLPPFSQLQTHQLAQECLTALTAQPGTAALMRSIDWNGWLDRIWRSSAGNALVIVETTRALAQQVWDEHTQGSVQQLPIPERVRALMLRRCERLSPVARDVADIVAVFGRDVVPEWLHGIAEDPQLSAAVSELLRAQLLRTQGEWLQLSHARAREILYSVLTPERRTQLHLQAAQALTRFARGHALEASWLGQAGFHYARAGDARAAVPLLRRFALHAQRSFGRSAAVLALEQASAVALQLPQTDRAEVRIMLAVERGFCLIFSGRSAELIEPLRQQSSLLDEVTQPELTAAFHSCLGLALALQGEHVDAEAALRLALHHADAGFTHIILAHVHLATGRCQEGVEHGRRAAALLARDWPEGAVIAHIHTISNLLWSGDWQRAQAIANEAESLADRRASTGARAGAAIASAIVNMHLRRCDAAVGDAGRALAASAAPVWRIPALWVLACAQAGLGLLEPALAQLDALEQVAEHGPLFWRCHVLLAFAEATLQAGAHSHAKHLAIDAVCCAERAGDLRLQPCALRVQALAEHALGEHAEAEAHILRALYDLEQLGLKIELAHTLMAHAHMQDERVAAVALQRARALYLTLGLVDMAAAPTFVLAQSHSHVQPIAPYVDTP